MQRRSDDLREMIRNKMMEIADLMCELTEASSMEFVGQSPSEMRMVEQYGEVMTREQAASILSVHRNTVGAMLRDGRLEGTSMHGVSTRSVARLLDAGKPTAQRIKRMAQTV